MNLFSSHQGLRATKNSRLLGPKRVAFQWAITIMVIGVPFVKVGGESLLRLDFKSLSLYAFGERFPITDLSLFLLVCIALTLLFLLITLAFGRAWCGWACPQTSLVDAVEWVAKKIGAKVSAGKIFTSPFQLFLMHMVYIFLAVIVGANLTWYFISPYQFFPQLINGNLHWGVVLTLAVVAITVYVDLAFLRRLFCIEFCPYGRFQTVLVDPGTLILQFPNEEARRCIQCESCVRSCPTGIDIRRGYQVECINCGRCLDACRQVMAQRQEPGIIRYTFGTENKGFKALFNFRMALVVAALAGALVGLVAATTQRDQVSFKVGRDSSLLPRTVDENRVINFFSAYLINRTNESVEFRLVIDHSGSDDLTLSGPSTIQILAPGEHQKVNFAILASQESLTNPRPVNVQLVGKEGLPLSGMTVFLTKPLEKTNE